MEFVEGFIVVVNVSIELFMLFFRLFGDFGELILEILKVEFFKIMVMMCSFRDSMFGGCVVKGY